jgi:hypothetical protein
MTAEQITELQVIKVRELVNVPEEQLSREMIVDVLRDMYPSEAAKYLNDCWRGFVRDVVPGHP